MCTSTLTQAANLFMPRELLCQHMLCTCHKPLYANKYWRCTAKTTLVGHKHCAAMVYPHGLAHSILTWSHRQVPGSWFWVDPLLSCIWPLVSSTAASACWAHGIRSAECVNTQQRAIELRWNTANLAYPEVAIFLPGLLQFFHILNLLHARSRSAGRLDETRTQGSLRSAQRGSN